MERSIQHTIWVFIVIKIMFDTKHSSVFRCFDFYWVQTGRLTYRHPSKVFIQTRISGIYIYSNEK